ncbi:MAG: NAD-dependent epimerase/dehydratase family protein [Chloroflexota bacterium]
MKALVIGGTGPTGPFLIRGLLERGYHVTILHRGTHEIDLPTEVAHIHGDAHFPETLAEALGSHTFDLAIAMYGRLRHVAEALRGRTRRFIGAGGVAVYQNWFAPNHSPEGLPYSIPEDAPLVTDPAMDSFACLMVQAEQAVMEGHKEGHYNATVLRFPMVYGGRQLIPGEWSILRRILDGRKHIIIPDGGLVMESRGYAENLAHAVLLCVEQPTRSAGQIYNIADEQAHSVRQWVQLISRAMGHDWELVSMPAILARPAVPYAMFARPGITESGALNHRVMDLTKVKRELGYRDIVPAAEALRRTVQWYLENQPERGGEIEQRLRDPFDYEAEDRLIRAYKRSIRRLQDLYAAPKWRHPYPHPKKSGLLRDEAGR